MEEYIENGAHLGWLIDPYQKRVQVHRPDREVQELDAPDSLAAAPVLPGFVLDLQPIW
jgi:Uma2 family endonuclease